MKDQRIQYLAELRREAKKHNNFTIDTSGPENFHEYYFGHSRCTCWGLSNEYPGSVDNNGIQSIQHSNATFG